MGEYIDHDQPTARKRWNKKVAQILAEKLGIWYYNREILYIAADKIGYDSLDERAWMRLIIKGFQIYGRA